MEMSFYEYLMTERDPNKTDEITEFANDAFHDRTFPKQSEDYDEVSSHLELDGHYLPSMTIFDDAWQRYIDKHSEK